MRHNHSEPGWVVGTASRQRAQELQMRAGLLCEWLEDQRCSSRALCREAIVA